MSDRAGKQIFHRKARKFNKGSSDPLAGGSSHFEQSRERFAMGKKKSARGEEIHHFDRAQALS